MFKVGDSVVVRGLNIESEIWKVDRELEQPRYFIKERSHMFVSYRESDLVLVQKVKASQIVTYSGLIFDYENIADNQITISDCIIPLSNICRFGGHTPEFYSVLNHSLNCYDFLVSQGVKCHETLLHALIHDFTEAYCGDMVKPLKIGMDSYNEKEEEIRKLVFPFFGVSDESYHRTKETVKFADNVMIANELKYIKNDLGTPDLQVLQKDYPYKPFIYGYQDKQTLIHNFKYLLHLEMSKVNFK